MGVVAFPFVPFVVVVGLVVFLFVLLFAVLIVILMTTPAAVFLSAKLKRSPVMAVFNRGGFLGFRRGKDADGGIAETKGGVWSLTEKSGLREEKSGVMTYFAPAEFASTMPPDFPVTIHELKARGYKFDTCEEFQEVLKKVGVDERVVVNGSTYKIHELGHIWPFNLNPAFVEAKIQYKIAERLKSFSMSPQTWMVVFVGLICAAIAYVIIRNASGGHTTVDAQCTYDLSEAAIRNICENWQAARQMTG